MTQAASYSPYPFTRAIQYAATTFWVSIFSVISTLVVPFLLTGLSQGQELLNTVTDEELSAAGGHWERPLHYVLFLAALLAWALANWYGSRLLLQRDFMMPKDDGKALAEGFRVWLNRWFPRLLAAFGMAVIVGYIMFVRGQYEAGSWALLDLAIFLGFVISRRKLFNVAATRAVLLVSDRIAIWLSLSLGVFLVYGFTVIDWSLARFLGAPVIVFLGLGSIVMMGAVVLTYLPLSYGWPSFAWVPFVAAFLLGLTGLNRNHAIAPRLIRSADPDFNPRPSVVDHFAQWLKSHGQGPIILVAAEGGASRSAWWTSHVLTALDAASDGEFSRHVYAVSGVSGGSLGAATYVSLLAERGAAKPLFNSDRLHFPSQEHCWQIRDDGPEEPLPVKSECFLERDFLSPTLGYLLFPDLVQRFVPFRVAAWDRSLGLERTWQIDWRTLFEKAPDQNPFARTLDALYVGQDPRTNPNPIPLLFLNSTRAQTGRAVLQAPVNIPSSELDDLFDARLHARGLPLSAVVHNSARFPVVSPGGEVDTWDRLSWDALVDGGYFENSGAATLAEFVRAVDLYVAQASGCVIDQSTWEEARKRIYILFIMNSPDEAHSPLGPRPSPDPLFGSQPPIAEEELMTPLAGLYETRTARGDSSKRFLVSLLSGGAGYTEVFMVLHRDPGAKNTDEPAMSWYLNRASRLLMWKAIALPQQRDTLCRVIRAIDPAKEQGCQERLNRFAQPPEE